MPLSARRNENESWYDCMIRYATPYGLVTEVVDCYNSHKAKAKNEIELELFEAESVLFALSEWDLLDYVRE